MINIEDLRKNPEGIKKAVARKGYKLDTDDVLLLDTSRRELIGEIEDLRKKANAIAAKGKDTSESDKEEGKGLKEEIKKKESELSDVEKKFNEKILDIPNPPLADVPDGEGEEDNKVIRKWGDIPKFSFEPKDHVEIGEKLDIIDTKRATKVTGARFTYLKAEAAWLEAALIQFTFEQLTSPDIIKKIANSVGDNYSDKVFVPIFPPAMVRSDVFTRMARLTEEDKDERYNLPKDNLYLIGSAEHTLGPIHMDETINEKDLPLRYFGFSTNFRREAGSYGKDTRGIIRLHQFDKLEMESFTVAEDSVKEQNFFVALQEHLMRLLGIPYQVVMISAGDMGSPDARQIDIEAWIPSQEKYRETHTADLMTDYQARRLNTKIKRKDGKTEFAHMNDATAFAIGRTLVAILENFQREDGLVSIPKILHKYLAFTEIRRE